MDQSKQMLDQLLDRSAELFSKVNPAELCGNIDKLSNCRPGLVVAAFNYLRSFGPDINHIIEPPSSDEASEPEVVPPSMKIVVDSLLDCNMACITDTFKPCEFQKPALIFIHLDTSVTSKSLSRVMSKISRFVDKVQVVDFATERGLTHCGVITISNDEESQRLYEKFKFEQVRGTLAARLHTIPGAQRNVQVKWFLNKSQDPSENWNAVVLRNLKRGCTVEEVQRVINEPVLRIERPREVQGIWCTLVVVKNVEDCERICINLNKRKLNSGERIKAHVHPHSRFFKRPADSHHRIFNTAMVTGKRPRSSSGTAPPKKIQKQKGVEDIKILFSQIIKAASSTNPQNGLNANPLSELVREKSEEPPLEEGEIHEPLREVEELERTDHYRLFEFGGLSCTWDVGIVRHSGIYIKTSHANEINESPYVE